MIELVLVAAGVFLICFLVYMGTRHLGQQFQEKTTRIFQTLAKDWNLEMTEAVEAFSNKWKPPVLNGKLGKHPVKIFMYEEDGADDIDTYTVVELTLPKQGTKFKLYRNHLVNKTFYGGSNVDLGDPAFKRAYILKSMQKAAMQHIFAKEIRAALVNREKGAYNEFLELKNEKLVFEMYFQLIQAKQKDNLEKMLKILEKMADRL